MTRNEISYQQNVESKRHNLRVEEETQRANLAAEELNRQGLAESARHNRAVEAETNRSNLAREIETNRHNVASEYYTGQQINLGYAQLDETRRHNEEVEQDNRNRTRNQAAYWNQSLEETGRHNVAMENNAVLTTLTGYTSKKDQVDALYGTTKMNNDSALARTIIQTVGQFITTVAGSALRGLNSSGGGSGSSSSGGSSWLDALEKEIDKSTKQ